MRRHWFGWVDEVEADRLWLRLSPPDKDWPEFEMWVPRCRLPEAERGTYVSLYVHQRGRKTRWRLRQWIPPRISDAEWARIWAEAEREAEELMAFVS